MRLIDCFMPAIAYVVELCSTATEQQPQYEAAKAEIQRLVSQSESLCRQGEVASGDYDQARFMVCAWIDETILASEWRHKRLWQHEQLQRLFYHTADAGVEAFERLRALEPHQREVREVYCICLALGFKGRFLQPGDEVQLEQLKQANFKLVAGASSPLLEEAILFPDAVAGHAPPSRQTRSAYSGRRLLVPLVLAVPVGLFALLYFIYHFTLSSITDRAVLVDEVPLEKRDPHLQ